MKVWHFLTTGLWCSTWYLEDDILYSRTSVNGSERGPTSWLWCYDYPKPTGPTKPLHNLWNLFWDCKQNTSHSSVNVIFLCINDKHLFKGGWNTHGCFESEHLLQVTPWFECHELGSCLSHWWAKFVNFIEKLIAKFTGQLSQLFYC